MVSKGAGWKMKEKWKIFLPHFNCVKLICTVHFDNKKIIFNIIYFPTEWLRNEHFFWKTISFESECEVHRLKWGCQSWMSALEWTVCSAAIVPQGGELGLLSIYFLIHFALYICKLGAGSMGLLHNIGPSTDLLQINSGTWMNNFLNFLILYT